MEIEAKKYLDDVHQAAERIADFTKGKTFADYEQDILLRSAVERQFQIIGDALAGLARLDPSLAERITEYRRIIAFRNIPVRGYAEVDHRIVWDIIQSKLPTLRREVALLLQDPLVAADRKTVSFEPTTYATSAVHSTERQLGPEARTVHSDALD